MTRVRLQKKLWVHEIFPHPIKIVSTLTWSVNENFYKDSSIRRNIVNVRVKKSPRLLIDLKQRKNTTLKGIEAIIKSWLVLNTAWAIIPCREIQSHQCLVFQPPRNTIPLKLETFPLFYRTSLQHMHPIEPLFSLFQHLPASQKPMSNPKGKTAPQNTL